jgi:hypothetical protein
MVGSCFQSSASSNHGKRLQCKKALEEKFFGSIDLELLLIVNVADDSHLEKNCMPQQNDKFVAIGCTKTVSK